MFYCVRPRLTPVCFLSSFFIAFIVISQIPLAGQRDNGEFAPTLAPLSNKTMSTPKSLEAFTGILTSVRSKGKMITLETDEGNATEIFSCKNGPGIRTAVGKKIKFKSLKPGMMVVVYYSSKRGRRSVKNVLVLKTGSAKKETVPDPPKS